MRDGDDPARLLVGVESGLRVTVLWWPRACEGEAQAGEGTGHEVAEQVEAALLAVEELDGLGDVGVLALELQQLHLIGRGQSVFWKQKG